MNQKKQNRRVFGAAKAGDTKATEHHARRSMTDDLRKRGWPLWMARIGAWLFLRGWIR
jgi:hypothetical protein